MRSSKACQFYTSAVFCHFVKLQVYCNCQNDIVEPAM